MAICEVFPNPTVKKVIFQIVFSNLFFMESKIGDIQLELDTEFPDSNLIYHRELFIGTQPKAHNIDNETESIKKIWQFLSPKGYELNIQNNSLDISSNLHKSYNNKNADYKFRDTIELALSVFLNKVPLQTIKRIGLRYIDECPLPDLSSNTLDSWYNTAFPLGRFSLEVATQMVFNTQIQRGKHFLRFVEQFDSSKGKPSYTLDFDGFTFNVAAKDCLSITDELHELISNEFEASIKEPVYTYMRSKKEL